MNNDHELFPAAEIGDQYKTETDAAGLSRSNFALAVEFEQITREEFADPYMHDRITIWGEQFAD